MAREFYSKPRYQELTLMSDRPYHVVIADDLGREAASALYESAGSNSLILLVTDTETEVEGSGAIRLGKDQLEAYLAETLSSLPPGTQFYLFGREQFLWPVHTRLMELHVPRSRCALQRCGPIDRDVFCIHCQHTMQGINHTQAICSGCGRLLHVYDHFSKRMGSYMGFQVNAECEAEIPEQEALHS
jgi:dimethylamine monooxygenase subunit C